MKRVLVVGSLNMDVVIGVERLPVLGETVLGREYWQNPGGKGANQAYAAGRLGGAVSMLGSVGKDKYGASMLKQLGGAGVEVGEILVDEKRPTGTAFVLTDAGGGNSIVVISGANESCTGDYIGGHEAMIAGADCVLLQLEVPLQAVERTIRTARALDKLVILNPAPARGDLTDTLLGMVDVITPNETELAALTGGRAETLEEIEERAWRLLDKGVGHVVVTLGARGALAVDRTGCRVIPGRKVSPVDTTAAGDCFNGALAVELTAGKDLDQAVAAANVAASISVTRRGAQVSIPSREEWDAACRECLLAAERR